MIAPTLVDLNFLSVDECQTVSDRLLHYKDQWICYKETELSESGNPDPAKHRLGFFGPSAYSFHNNIEKYIELKTHYNDLLSAEFSDLYVRLKTAISRSIGITTFYCDDVSYPGFHIFGPGLENQSVSYDYFGFHQDNFSNQFRSIVPYQSTFSFTVPIKLPKNGSSLTYYNAGAENNVRTYEYTAGSLSYWPGDLHHKISDFILDGGDDYMITWQIHVGICGSVGIIYW
jgi:hypothetical protein